jgi:hypothetical protein
MEKISWTDDVKNEEVLQSTKKERKKHPTYNKLKKG